MHSRIQRRFFDASVLGLGHLLGRTDSRIIFPGHPDWPFGPSADDDVWLAHVGDLNWTAFMRDKKVRTRPGERAALIGHRVRAINITVSKNRSPEEYAELLAEHAQAIDEVEAQEPAYFHLTQSGLTRHIQYPR